MRKITRFLAIGIVGLLIISGFIGLASSTGAGQDVTPSDDINSATPKSSSKTLTSHDPIYIDGNTAFAENASTEGWAGDGTEGNPYILQNPYITENYNINASTAHGIYIENTDVYFIIRNCTIYDGKSNQNGGIYFYKCNKRQNR